MSDKAAIMAESVIAPASLIFSTSSGSLIMRHETKTSNTLTTFSSPTAMANIMPEPWISSEYVS